jgi:crotonobetaine/carnitine-CoA ligase
MSIPTTGKGAAAMRAEELTPHAVARMAATAPDRIAVEQAGGPRTTYGELHTAALRWAHALELAGARAGDRIATMLPTSIEAFTVQLAVACLGGTAVALNTLWRGTMLARALSVTHCTVLVTTEDHRAEVAALDLAAVGPRAIVLVDAVAGVDHGGTSVPVLLADELLAGAEPSPRRGPVPEGIQGVIFTSGTSGPSKPVQLSHEFFLTCARRLIPGGADASGGAYYSPWPMGHSLGSLALAAAVDRGVRLVLRAGFSPDSFWPDVREFDCRTVVLVTVAQALGQRPFRADDADNPLRYVTMAPLIQDYRGFAERFDVEVSGMYGMTEIGPALTCSMPADHRVAGRPADGYECRVADQAGAEQPDGTPGELLVRAANQRALMSGYAGMAAESARAFTDGWFHTGDLFVRQPTGDYYFLDRLKDSIRRRGRNISSFEIEAEAATHPSVLQCAAVGVPADLASDTPRADEEVKIFVVPRPGSELTPHELAEFLGARLPRYMVPRYVEFAESLPTGTTHRPVKAVLRTLPNTRATFDRQAKI